MDTVDIRTARPQDRPGILALARSALLQVDTEDLDGLDRVLWADVAGIGVVAEHAGELVGGVFAGLRIDAGAEGDTVACLKLVVVAGSARRRGVGGLLLDEMERRARHAGAGSILTGGNAPAYWWPGIDRGFADAVAFFEQRGYAEARDAVNLRVDLEANAERIRASPPAGLSPRRLTEDEWPRFGDWMRRTWGEAWTAETRAAYDRDPVSCFVASEGDAYLGFAAYDTNRRGWFGPMGSDPSARGRGVGGALLRMCLADYLAAGRENCDIAWAGALEFYAEAVGAEVGRRFTLMQRSLSLS